MIYVLLSLDDSVHDAPETNIFGAYFSRKRMLMHARELVRLALENNKLPRDYNNYTSTKLGYVKIDAQNPEFSYTDNYTELTFYDLYGNI